VLLQPDVVMGTESCRRRCSCHQAGGSFVVRSSTAGAHCFGIGDSFCLFPRLGSRLCRWCRSGAGLAAGGRGSVTRTEAAR
jgi:hypothetical protein